MKVFWFVFNWFIYLLVLIVTTVYSYARLDYVRTKPLSENVKKT